MADTPRHRASVLSVAEMGAADRLAMAAGVPGIDLMEQAGRALAQIALAGRAPGHLVVVAGPGNNGGDGYVAARLARDWGWPVSLLSWGDPAALTGDAGEAARRWNAPVVPASAQGLADATLIIDALFGAGLSRPLDGEAAALARAMTAHPAPVVAADIPSGLDGTTGQPPGPCVRADATVTFFRPKPAHVLLPGRALCGAVHVVDIGIPHMVLDTIGPRLFANTPVLWDPLFPRLAWDTHKFARGHTAVLSGGPLATGAARLSALSALRVGSGLVTLACPRNAAFSAAHHVTAVMVRSIADAADLMTFCNDRKVSTLVLGPGAGVTPETRACVEATLGSGRAAVLDADALTVFAEAPSALFAAAGPQTVLTPHDGEFARLFPDLVPGQGAARIAAARTAAARAGAIVVLKGPNTIIAAPDGAAAITSDAPPTLATAGSGDVLAGLIAGLLAQGMPAFEAACAGAWLHADAARRFGPGLIAEDLPALVPQSLAAVENGRVNS